MPQPLHPIESTQNPQFKLWEGLTEARGIRKAGLFLLSGRKTVPEALARVPDRFSAVLTPAADLLDGLDLPDRLRRVLLAQPLFDRLDTAGTKLPLLVGSVPPLPMADLSAPPQGLELLCALGDPSNLGALMRSAASFGVRRLVLLEGAAHPYHPRCLRAASNAWIGLDIARGPRWQDLAGAAGPVFALDGDGQDMAGFPWPRDLRLILGEEGQGVPLDLDVERLAIPTTGAVESLNATIAASIALYSHFAAGR